MDVCETAAAVAAAVAANAKEKTVQKIRSMMGEKALSYDAIHAARMKRLEIPNLLGGDGVFCADGGTMLSEGDGRLIRANVKVSMGQQRTTSCSFDSASMKCLCEGGLITGRGGEDKRVAIALADQSYPPMWECNGDKMCISIIRVEFAMLDELADELIARLRGRYVVAGSIKMLFSATSLAVAGTTGYCEDLLAAINKLKRSIGEHVIFTALPHFFIGGCGDRATIRSVVEVGVWAPHYFGAERIFQRAAFLKANEFLLEAGTGGPQPAINLRHRIVAAAPEQNFGLLKA
jgi:hypothetical protein